MTARRATNPVTPAVIIPTTEPARSVRPPPTPSRSPVGLPMPTSSHASRTVPLSALREMRLPGDRATPTVQVPNVRRDRTPRPVPAMASNKCDAPGSAHERETLPVPIRPPPEARRDFVAIGAIVSTEPTIPAAIVPAFVPPPERTDRRSRLAAMAGGVLVGAALAAGAMWHWHPTGGARVTASGLSSARTPRHEQADTLRSLPFPTILAIRMAAPQPAPAVEPTPQPAATNVTTVAEATSSTEPPHADRHAHHSHGAPQYEVFRPDFVP